MWKIKFSFTLPSHIFPPTKLIKDSYIKGHWDVAFPKGVISHFIDQIKLHAMLTLQLFCLALSAVFVHLLFTGRRPKNYPPGPPTLPILGNIHLVSCPVSARFLM
jgi:hypothetical protein